MRVTPTPMPGCRDDAARRLVNEVRAGCAAICDEAHDVRIVGEALADYAQSLPLAGFEIAIDPDAHVVGGTAEERSAFFLTLAAINFGSGWWPTIRKREGLSGYMTMATALTERFEREGPWDSGALAEITAAEIAAVLRQDPEHELMELYAQSLRDLGSAINAEHGNRFLSVVDAAAGSALSFVEILACWPCFDDVSLYRGRSVPFLKRAQLAAADLASVGVANFEDVDKLTAFADNLVPHVLRVDGVLRYTDGLLARIDAGELIPHSSPEEVEIRAAAVHAVELIAAENGVGPRVVDYYLWSVGHELRYKALPRHRTRCTAY